MERKEDGRKERKLVFDEVGVKAFGDRFAYLRKQAGYTQEQLAFESGIIRSQIARIEAAQINPTISTIFVLARTMDVKIEEFFKIEI